MATKSLFSGHKYTFNKTSGSLVLIDATDNSHEKVTFREGLIASESIQLIDSELLVQGESNSPQRTR